MIVEERIVYLKDDGACLLKTPEEDGETLLSYLKRINRETDFLNFTREEVETVTAENEAEWVRGYRNGKSILIGAYRGGELIGLVDCTIPSLFKTAHVGIIGVSVLKKAWGNGVGTKLFEAVFEEAKRASVSVLHLEHFADNVRAHALYEKVGFVTCGIFRGGVKKSDGTISDVVLMERAL
ncbi:MAG: GNAT family N-acetyltransferase [Clostridia bacterium]|nr:GNAT family N-acetyltransferase [Clostridia bacterium]